MKKLLLILLLASPVFGSQKYGFKDPHLDDEFVNNYKEHSFPNIVNGRASTMTVTQLNVGTMTVTGGIRGTTTNNDACAGCVGEYKSSATLSLINTPATGVYGESNSISLTPGDWDVTFQIEYQSNAAIWTLIAPGISSTAGNSSAGLVDPENSLTAAWASSAVTPTAVPVTIANYRVSLAATTTYYGKVRANFTAGQPVYVSRLSARRPR